jgi:hypothetical protein
LNEIFAPMAVRETGAMNWRDSTARQWNNNGTRKTMQRVLFMNLTMLLVADHHIRITAIKLP